MSIGKKYNNGWLVRWGLMLVFLLSLTRALAQDKPVEGIVFDKDTKERIARVGIINVTTGESFYNNLKGEFSIKAKPGDKLVFAKLYYLNDTITVKNYDNLAIYLPRNSIMLREVTIRDTLATPMQRLMDARRTYNKAYGSNAYSDPFSTTPGGGAGISIDAIYNALSRSGRNARHLQGLIQQDYEQDVIDHRFNRAYVANITSLKGDELSEFMKRYRPSYFTVSADTEYEFITYIRTSLRHFLRIKRVHSQPPLKPAES